MPDLPFTSPPLTPAAPHRPPASPFPQAFSGSWMGLRCTGKKSEVQICGLYLYRRPQVPASLPGVDSRRLKGSLVPRPSLHIPPMFHYRPPGGGGPCLLAAPWVTRYCYLLRPLWTLTLEPQMTGDYGGPGEIGGL